MALGIEVRLIHPLSLQAAMQQAMGRQQRGHRQKRQNVASHVSQ
jgi:hypothetical protein